MLDNKKYLNKAKVSSLHKETGEIYIHFFGCYTTWLKDGFCAVANIGIETLMHIQIVIPIYSYYFLLKENSIIRLKHRNDDLERMEKLLKKRLRKNKGFPYVLSEGFSWQQK